MWFTSEVDIQVYTAILHLICNPLEIRFSLAFQHRLKASSVWSVNPRVLRFNHFRVISCLWILENGDDLTRVALICTDPQSLCIALLGQHLHKFSIILDMLAQIRATIHL